MKEPFIILSRTETLPPAITMLSTRLELTLVILHAFLDQHPLPFSHILSKIPLEDRSRTDLYALTITHALLEASYEGPRLS